MTDEKLRQELARAQAEIKLKDQQIHEKDREIEQTSVPLLLLPVPFPYI